MSGFDYSSSFAGINNALANIGKQNEIAYQRQALANLGQKALGGDYNAAAQAAFAAGDAGTGLGLLKLGQTQKQESDWLKANAGIFSGATGLGGATSTPASYSPGDPRGVRNLNPGNIEDGNFARSQPGYSGSDGRFAKFDTMENGVNAQGKLLETYNRKYGINTVSGVVNRWAPSAENGAATGNYANFVARKLGVGPNDAIDLTNPETQRRVALAMAEFENGRPIQLGGHVAGAQPRPAAPQGVQVAENEADVARIEAQMPGYGGGQPAQVAQTIQGDDPAKLRADAQYYAQSNPEAARQMVARADAIESGRGVQVAQATRQPGAPVADVPAPGAVNAQGFAIPGGDAVPQSIANDPRVMNLQRALAGAPERFKPSIQSRLNVLVEELKAARAESAPTSSMKEYRQYQADERAAGRTPGDFTSWKRANSAAGASSVNLPPAEKEYDKQSAKDFAELNRDVAKRGANANGKIATLNRLETLLSDPNVRTGAGAQAALTLARAAKSLFGIETEGLGPAEAVNAIANGFALELRNPSGGAGMPGALSDKDREFLMSLTPGLERTPEGNKLIIDYMKRLAKRDVDIEGLRRDYIKQNKRLDDGFYEKLSEFSEKNPLFPEAAKAAPTDAGPRRVSSPDELKGLPSGTLFIDPNGLTRRVP